jgi:hypothetical protein
MRDFEWDLRCIIVFTGIYGLSLWSAAFNCGYYLYYLSIDDIAIL